MELPWAGEQKFESLLPTSGSHDQDGRHTHIWSSPQKPLDLSKPNFIWSLHGLGEQKFTTSGLYEQDGRHAIMLKTR